MTGLHTRPTEALGEPVPMPALVRMAAPRRRALRLSTLAAGNVALTTATVAVLHLLGLL